MDDALTLPGTIPGLLRRGSPVRLDVAGYSFCGVALDDTRDAGYAAVCWRNGDHGPRRTGDFDLSELALDLSDPTGRAHAVWWVRRIPGCMEAVRPVDNDMLRVTYLIRDAADGADMPHEDADLLRRIVLHLAGVTNV